MITTDQQVRIIMKELSKHGKQGGAAAKAGVCRQTVACYLQAGKLPSELKKAHEWQTRENPFAEVWPEYILVNNRNPKPFVWTKQVEDILEKISHC